MKEPALTVPLDGNTAFNTLLLVRSTIRRSLLLACVRSPSAWVPETICSGVAGIDGADDPRPANLQTPPLVLLVTRKSPVEVKRPHCALCSRCAGGPLAV